MPIIVLIPTVVCIVALFRDSVQKAFLNVYLTIFMLFPIYYWWKVAALPPIDVSEAVLLPLGIAILIRELPAWRVSTMDLWVCGFIFTSYYADSLARLDTASTFDLFSNVIIAGVPYMAGKLLIEQKHARIATLKRIVFLLFVASLIGAYEYRMGQNPFSLFWSRFFPGETFAWKTQIRWGFGRLSGPYGQSELAGIIIFFGLVFTLYLNQFKLWEPRFSRAPWLPWTKARILTWVIALTLLMTQARGPWLGAMVAVPVALIGRSKRTLRTLLLVAGIGLIVAPIIYLGLKQYASAGAPSSSEQESAAYRSQMIAAYIPIAKQGGPWGWGQNFPHVMGFDSIDNEYLFVALTQGWVGLACFCLIAAQTLGNLLSITFFGKSQQDRAFGWSMLGIVLGFLLTVFTVYLGNQPFELFFLQAGWSEALRTRRAEQPHRAFQQVYT
jgi:hypothetical protein